MIKIGDIVTNLSSDESVKIIGLKNIGNDISIEYVGLKSKTYNTKILNSEKASKLDILTKNGEFNFNGDPEKFILCAEAERINSAYQFDPLFAINCSVVDPLPHQVEAVYKYLLPQPKIRFLLADDTGAGKTIMTGLLIKEMIMRHMIERILIITPGGLTKQWQEDEMNVKFNIHFRLVNRNAFNSEPTVFQSCDRIVTSIDFICQDDVKNILSRTNWDLIVFDEAHKLSAYEYGNKLYKSKRYEIAHLLSSQCEHLLLLTATPHRGRIDTFKNLLQLLDADIFATGDLAAARVKELEENGANKFFIRRLKEDMRDWSGEPLYKARYTKTVSYQLTEKEEELYKAVTAYLTPRKEEAQRSKNIHVSLALQVMQRRLTSSIFAIRNTLLRRYQALQELVVSLQQNPQLWNQKLRFEDFSIDNFDDYDELDDNERESLDNIFSDPKKFRMFTTASNMQDLTKEAAELKSLFEQADKLYNEQHEERKYAKLKELLKENNVLDNEKLVIFTEHKDTLLYLRDRLTNNGYSIATIHGGMSVDERRAAQNEFMSDHVQILIATDAAGEGINLQFSRLLINWDIPWNPNRLEQRMGRIHRYGQKEDVMVFNLVAANTREGQVLSTLLTKLDLIREHLGDDRVYDVIQDVLSDVSLESIIQSVLNGRESDLDIFLNKKDDELQKIFKDKIDKHSTALAHSKVNYIAAHELKEESDERRLQPIYIRQFFEKAFHYLGGEYHERQKGIYQITRFPDEIVRMLKERYKIYASNLVDLFFCFDKHIFIDYQLTNSIGGSLHYINPGNPIFDSLVNVVRNMFHNDMLSGTVLVSPDDTHPYLAYIVKNQIIDNRPSISGENVASEILSLVVKDEQGSFARTSPAHLLDLCPPAEFAKQVTPPAIANTTDVLDWSYQHISKPLFEDTCHHVEEDARKRREYLETAFEQILIDIQSEINDLQGKSLWGDNESIQQKLQNKILRLEELKLKRVRRMEEMRKMAELDIKEPLVMGCAYVLPLTQVEYQGTFGMSRDDEVESIAMHTAIDYEKSQGRTPTDVSKDNMGYDIRSIDINGQRRYIEVKGRAATDGVMLSENEMNRLAQLADRAWLYIVIECRHRPQLLCIQNPANTLHFEQKSKGIQFFLPLNEWQKNIHANNQ